MRTHSYLGKRMRRADHGRKSAWRLAFGFPIGSYRRPTRIFRPQVESLEDRWLLSTITDLDTLGGASFAYGLNNAGQVVGRSFLSRSSGPYHAFLWDSSNRMQDLDTLGGDNSQAFGINDAGQVVGDSSLSGSSPSHAFLWDSMQGMQDLGTLGGPSSSAKAINTSGQVVGVADTTYRDPARAFMWDSKQGMQDLHVMGFDGDAANGINDTGQIVGTANDCCLGHGELFYHAFLWDTDHGPTYIDLNALHCGNSDCSIANGINAAGQIVGSANFGGNYPHALLWQGQSVTDLGTLDGSGQSEANAINAAGQVVGVSDTTAGVRHAFLWQSGQKMTDLNDLLPDGSGWTLNSAQVINDRGQIAGYGVHNGQTRAFLLTLAATITPTSLQWNDTRGGVDYGYRVSGADVPQDTTVALYWSSSDQFADRLGGPIPGTSRTIAAGKRVGTYGPFHKAARRLQNVPDGAAYLLVVTDPDNVLGNFDEAANVRAVANPLFVPQGQFTFNLEGLDNPKGRYFSRHIHWPGGRSGVTIGRGYDLGHRNTSEVVQDLTGAGVPLMQAQQIAAGARLRGPNAQNFVLQNQALIGDITREQQQRLFNIDYSRYVSKAQTRYIRLTNGMPGAVAWDDLDRAIQVVLVDFLYNSGRLTKAIAQAAMTNDSGALADYITTHLRLNYRNKERVAYLRENRPDRNRGVLSGKVLGDALPNSLPADYPFRPADVGKVYFLSGATQITPSVRTITASGTADGTISGSAPITVNVGGVPGMAWNTANQLDRAFALVPDKDRAGFRLSELPDLFRNNDWLLA